MSGSCLERDYEPKMGKMKMRGRLISVGLKVQQL